MKMAVEVDQRTAFLEVHGLVREKVLILDNYRCVVDFVEAKHPVEIGTGMSTELAKVVVSQDKEETATTTLALHLRHHIFQGADLRDTELTVNGIKNVSKVPHIAVEWELVKQSQNVLVHLVHHSYVRWIAVATDNTVWPFTVSDDVRVA